MQKACRRPHAYDQAPTPTSILGISSLTNRTVKRNREQRTSPLNIIPVMCKERLKVRENTYRLDVQLID